MLGVTCAGDRDIAYEYATLDRIVLCVVKSDKFCPDAVRYAPTVHYKDGLETAAFYQFLILVNLRFGLRIAFSIDYNGKTGSEIPGT
jgi:hypothetical protein